MKAKIDGEIINDYDLFQKQLPKAKDKVVIYDLETYFYALENMNVNEVIIFSKTDVFSINYTAKINNLIIYGDVHRIILFSSNVNNVWLKHSVNRFVLFGNLPNIVGVDMVKNYEFFY